LTFDLFQHGDTESTERESERRAPGVGLAEKIGGVSRRSFTILDSGSGSE
jgi:hypothetical protein